MNYSNLFNSFKSIRVAVIGDVMLDTYWWGRVDRISPEAPVPVVALQRKEYRIGGAGNVALNLAALDAQVDIISVIGRDEDGERLKHLMKEEGIGVHTLLESSERITTNKIRVIGRNQQMMRLDVEIEHELSEAVEAELKATWINYLNENNPQIVILEDYNKGVLSKNIIQYVLHECKRRNILTAVDPKKNNFFEYKGVTLFKPNLKEVKEALNITINSINLENLAILHAALSNHLNHSISFITLSEHGVFYQQNDVNQIIPSHIRNIADVSGAGDTVIAVAALVFAASADIHLAASIANIAGGLVCEEVGTVAINKEKLLTEVNYLL